MEEYFINSDIVILPYNSATQSGVVIDSYKYSRPVIAFDVGALSEQIINGNTGFLIKNKNIDEFVNKITMFLKLKKNEKNTLSKNAWNFYMNQYCNIKNEEVIFNFLSENKTQEVSKWIY